MFKLFFVFQIMKKRISSFSLLLGGGHDFDVEDVKDVEELWRNEVITLAQSQLRSAGDCSVPAIRRSKPLRLGAFLSPFCAQRREIAGQVNRFNGVADLNRTVGRKNR